MHDGLLKPVKKELACKFCSPADELNVLQSASARHQRTGNFMLH
jgi:hypothetical protein